MRGRLQLLKGAAGRSRLAEAAISRGEEVALRPTQHIGGTAARVADQAGIGCWRSRFERAELRIGADPFSEPVAPPLVWFTR